MQDSCLNTEEIREIFTTLGEVNERTKNIEKKLNRICWREDNLEKRVEVLERFKSTVSGGLAVLAAGLGILASAVARIKVW